MSSQHTHDSNWSGSVDSFSTRTNQIGTFNGCYKSAFPAWSPFRSTHTLQCLSHVHLSHAFTRFSLGPCSYNSSFDTADRLILTYCLWLIGKGTVSETSCNCWFCNLKFSSDGMLTLHLEHMQHSAYTYLHVCTREKFYGAFDITAVNVEHKWGHVSCRFRTLYTQLVDRPAIKKQYIVCMQADTGV